MECEGWMNEREFEGKAAESLEGETLRYPPQCESSLTSGENWGRLYTRLHTIRRPGSVACSTICGGAEAWCA